MKKIVSIMAFLLTTILLVSCSGGEPTFDFERGYITVGMEADYAPFNWLETSPNEYNYPIYGEANSYVAGFDVDMARHIASELNLELRIKTIEWLSLIPALQTGEIDLIIAGMSPTEERRAIIGFTDAYYISNHVLVVRSDRDIFNVDSLEELEGYRGVGQLSTIYANLVDFLADNYGTTALPVVNSVTAATTQLLGANPTADFTIVEKPVALGIVAQFPNLAIIFDVEENIFEVSDEERELSIGHRIGDTVLGNLVNEALETVTGEMVEEWMDNAVYNSAQ